MAHYLVRARLKSERAQELRRRLEEKAFESIKPFGRGLSRALENARHDPKTGEVIWEEQCFCSPPLAAERVAVLDRYFDDIETKDVASGEGWRGIEELPPLWNPPLALK